MASARFRDARTPAQAVLFHECFEDAVGTAVQAAGGVKRVAYALWPNAPLGHAERKMRDSLNVDRPEKFSPDELVRIIKLAREANDHSILKYLCAECGYQAPVPVSPEQERAQLEREFNAGVMRLEALAKRLGK